MCTKDGQKSLICYITEQDPVQDALEKNKKTMHFKPMLPNTGNKLKVAIWVSETPKQFLLHICTAMDVCKQINLDTKEATAMLALKASQCKLDALKAEYTQLVKTTRTKTKEQKEKDENPAPDVQKKEKEQKEKGENPAPDVSVNATTLAAVKKAREGAARKIQEVKLAVAMAGAKPFKLYRNLLSDETRQPWEKVIKAQVMQTPWEDIFGVPYTETPTKSRSSFCKQHVSPTEYKCQRASL